MDEKCSTAPQAVATPRGRRLFPPAGTLVLCLLTIATAGAQSILADQQISQAVGVDLNNLRSPSSLVSIADGQAIPAWLTLFTHVFPHGGWWHVLPNVTALWVFGAIAEGAFGSWRFVAAYLASGGVGVSCDLLIPPYPAHPAAGASLAIAGIIGAYSAVRWSRGLHTRLQSATIIALEAALSVGVLTWLAFRTIPTAPDRICSVMYHFVPLLVMWFVVRAYVGCRRFTQRFHDRST